MLLWKKFHQLHIHEMNRISITLDTNEIRQRSNSQVLFKNQWAIQSDSHRSKIIIVLFWESSQTVLATSWWSFIFLRVILPCLIPIFIIFYCSFHLQFNCVTLKTLWLPTKSNFIILQIFEWKYYDKRVHVSWDRQT